jgi:hypothetical protein
MVRLFEAQTRIAAQPLSEAGFSPLGLVIGVLLPPR